MRTNGALFIDTRPVAQRVEFGAIPGAICRRAAGGTTGMALTDPVDGVDIAGSRALPAAPTHLGICTRQQGPRTLSVVRASRPTPDAVECHARNSPLSHERSRRPRRVRQSSVAVSARPELDWRFGSADDVVTSWRNGRDSNPRALWASRFQGGCNCPLCHRSGGRGYPRSVLGPDGPAAADAERGCRPRSKNSAFGRMSKAWARRFDRA